METKYKFLSKTSIKDVDVKGRTVTGYFASWGKPMDATPDEPMFIDSDGDVFDPHAFDTTIMQNGPKGANRIWHLFNHNPGMPIGKPKELFPDNFGVFFATQFPDTVLANDKLKLYEAGFITEHSVIFETKSEEKASVNNQTFNLIREVKMCEVSSVLWGANSNTPTMGIKSETARMQMSVLDNILHNGTLSDETFLLIEKMFNDLKAIFKGSDQIKPTEITDVPAKTNTALEILKMLNTKI